MCVEDLGHQARVFNSVIDRRNLTDLCDAIDDLGQASQILCDDPLLHTLRALNAAGGELQSRTKMMIQKMEQMRPAQEATERP